MNSPASSHDHGYVPLGKYSSARDDILHFLCTSDWSNGEFGNTEAPTGYVWKISNDPEDVSLENGEFNSVIEEWFKMNPEVTDSAELRAELVGNFLVNADDRGFIYVMDAGSKETQTEIFNELSNQFDEWDEQGEF